MTRAAVRGTLCCGGACAAALGVSLAAAPPIPLQQFTAGAHWLIDQGIADPSRLCIVGWSYGGYAALIGVAKEPQRYRCAVSIAGVSDLSQLVRETTASTAARTRRSTRSAPTRPSSLWRPDMRLNLYTRLEAFLAANLAPH